MHSLSLSFTKKKPKPKTLAQLNSKNKKLLHHIWQHTCHFSVTYIADPHCFSLHLRPTNLTVSKTLMTKYYKNTPNKNIKTKKKDCCNLVGKSLLEHKKVSSSLKNISARFSNIFFLKYNDENN